MCRACRARKLNRSRGLLPARSGRAAPPVAEPVAHDGFRTGGERLDGPEDADQPTPPTGAPSPAPAPTPPPVPCAHPINWNHSGASDNGPDGIQIPITWGSSTGSLADLSNCTVREVVTYDPIPNPPFIWNPPNPTILTVPAVLGAGQDTHSYPPGLLTGITNPRASGTAVAHQQYQFRCTGPGCSGSWVNFPGQAYTITREVFPQFVRLNPWRYQITKDGVGNPFHYSREVAVPEPPAPAPAPGPVGP
jgi:hypothetical protein